MSADDILQEVARQVSGCTSCSLHHSRKKSVPGEGPADADILLIGEGPGFYENEQGRPFVGAAGKYLDELLGKGGLKREQVFITNVVKCRPPGNREPAQEELGACGQYLERQIEAINPHIIITLGRFSMARFLANTRISDVHGQPRWIRGRLIIPMFHPAAALHQPSLKTAIERDFSRLPEFLEQARKAQPQSAPVTQPSPARAQPALPEAPALSAAADDEEPPDDGGPTQLSLF